MARVSPKAYSFGRGEVSPKLHSKQDLELYYAALGRCLNYIVDGRAILENRPGTKQAGRTKSDGAAELIPFVYSQSQSYVLEMSDQLLRAWYDEELVLDGGSPFELAVPYSDTEAAEISYCQDKDYLFVTHASHAPSEIWRDSATSFDIDDIETNDGPYLELNPNPDYKLEIEAVGVSANVGRVTFSTIPVSLLVGSIISIWDGEQLQTMTVGSINAGANQCETNWTGAPISSTAQWSWDGNPPDTAGDTATVDGVSGVTTGKLKATGGHTPFDGARDPGRWVRLLEEDETAAESASLEERFQWHYFKIVSVTTTSEAAIEWTGGNVPATADWRLGAFYPGNYPSSCTFHENRLCFGLGNKVYMSASGSFKEFGPSDVDSSVNPDNAITVPIPATNAKKGVTSDVVFMQSLGFQLVIGTPGGNHTIQSSSFGEALQPDTVTRRPQDSRGAAAGEPIMVGDSVIYLHKSRKKLMGTYYKDSFDKIGSQDLSLAADHLVEARIKGVVWQEEPHSIAWIHMDDGTFAGLTIQPEEKVQAWHRHRLGGSYLNGGNLEHPHVESMAVIPDSNGDDRLYMIAKRTIDGSTQRHVEVLNLFRPIGQNLKDAQHLDASLKYEGNTDAGKSITFTGAGISTRSAVTNFASPAFVDGQTLTFHDGHRWHHGRIDNVDGSNDFDWIPTLPNAQPGPADGAKWHYVDGTWTQLAAGSEIDVNLATYDEPGNQTAITRWSAGVNTLSGFDDLEGEDISLLIDGVPQHGLEVSAGAVSGFNNGHIITGGLPYESIIDILPIEAGSKTGSAQNKQRPVYRMDVDVMESRELQGGTGKPSSYNRAWAQYIDFDFPDLFAVIEGEPLPPYSGYLPLIRDEQGDVDNPSVSIRQKEPLPSTIRGLVLRLNQSDGR